MTDFETWWYLEGSTPPLPGEDGEEHCRRMCKIAWSNGAFKERERFAGECIDLVAMYGGPVDLEAAIRSRSKE